MSRARHRNTDDIPGLTAALTTPFVIAAVVLIMIWLNLNGFIGGAWTWIFGGAGALGLTAAQVPLYRSLIGGSISRPGCLAGLYTYGASLVLCLILFWQGGLTGALIGVLLVPICCFGIAAFVTAREPGRGGRRRR